MNYLVVVNEDFIKKYPNTDIDWGIARGVFCEELFKYLLKEINVDLQEVRPFSLSQVKSPIILEKMIKNLCKNINKLDHAQTRSLQSANALHVIIMEIWLSLKSFYKHDEREIALQDLLELIENEVVIEKIKSMDLHFKQHHFRDDPSKSQF